MQRINFKVVVTSALATMFIAALVVVAAAQTGGSAAAAATGGATTAQAVATPAAGNSNSSNAAPAPQADTYYKTYLQDLATNLGVGQDKLTSSMTQAAKDTIAQAVKDGKLTQAQADQLDTQIDNMATNGIYGYNGFGHGPGMGGPRRGDGFGPGAPISSTTMTNLTNAVAAKLGLTVAQMNTDFQNGQTIADLAKAANVSLADIKTLIINTVKPDLDAAVKAGNMTQAQEDSFIQRIQNDTFTHPGLGFGFGGHGHGPGMGGPGMGGPGGNDNDSDDSGSSTAPSATPGSGNTN